jgi:hypothetical protein
MPAEEHDDAVKDVHIASRPLLLLQILTMFLGFPIIVFGFMFQTFADEVRRSPCRKSALNLCPRNSPYLPPVCIAQLRDTSSFFLDDGAS